MILGSRAARGVPFVRDHGSMLFRRSLLLLALAVGPVAGGGDLFAQTSDSQKANLMDKSFEELSKRYLDEFPALSPVNATGLGDHRFDHQLDQVSDEARTREAAFYRKWIAELEAIDRSKLSRQQQVDRTLLLRRLRNDLWSLEELREWEWNPIAYTQLSGGAVYSLLAREFAPIETRLVSVAARLEQYPRLLEQVRTTLKAERTPRVHAETAIKQNRGVLSTIDEMVKPAMGSLPDADRKRLERAIVTATEAIETHQVWLEKELLPKTAGDARIGLKLFDEKLARTLDSKLTRQEIRERAEFELHRIRKEMYALAGKALKARDPKFDLPAEPTADQQQEVIQKGINLAAAEIPPRDGVVAAAETSLEITTKFVREHDLITIPPDPLRIIIMPEFQRGVSVAYCDSPGALEVGQKTFYAVAPLPTDWSDEQCRSFLREYNIRSIHNLTVHEAMPGHFVQIALSNRNPSRLRSLLSSGTFVEGWACYTEQMMSEEGFMKDDPLMRLVTLKWNLRTIANAILDQSLHVDGMNREEAMRLMTRDTFQEEREAAGKWVRAQVTSCQLSTYFVGYQEHRDLRRATEKAKGDKFSLKTYHDDVCSHGSPPVEFVKALVLDQPIPE
jgi:uncharacterized protein (DUF885 family)